MDELRLFIQNSLKGILRHLPETSHKGIEVIRGFHSRLSKTKNADLDDLSREIGQALSASTAVWRAWRDYSLAHVLSMRRQEEKRSRQIDTKLKRFDRYCRTVERRRKKGKKNPLKR